MPRIFKAQFIIGVDPGKKTGVALWDTQNRELVELKTLDFWDAMNYCQSLYEEGVAGKEETAIVLENPGVNKPTFGRGKMKRKILDRKAQNVGSNKREAILLGEGLEREGYVVKYVAPVQAEKWDAKKLEQITGWASRTSQHARDAARLVFNRGSRIVIPE